MNDTNKPTALEALTEALLSVTRTTQANSDSILALRLAVEALLESDAAAQKRYEEKLSNFMLSRLDEEGARRVQSHSKQLLQPRT
ncbi:hypothetical protein FOZ76_14570 [Verticiella sediminum]|uniref:Uncharacterized protein n=1 Tax=Verticiella sediminum TaxID=1247510 RepID=A0A556AID3_9BURK|nr:hypothetical protein [Verticiella sediminum]TSH92641.1 hypothetical protein FOZ76_14570 [Verticiella sediminum]